MSKKPIKISVFGEQAVKLEEAFGLEYVGDTVSVDLKAVFIKVDAGGRSRVTMEILLGEK